MMAIPKPGEVRMGGGPRPWARLRFALMGLLVIAVLAMAVWLVLGQRQDETSGKGHPACATDAQCGPQRLCAQGGCLILISSELPELWHRQLEQQLTPEPNTLPWQPTDEYGEKLFPATRCPSPQGGVVLSDQSKLRTLYASTVYVYGGDALLIHGQLRVVADIWVDSVRFRFPREDLAPFKQLCAGENVHHALANAAVFGTRKVLQVDASLAQAAPAETPATASVALERSLGPTAADGMRSLELFLDPAMGGATKRTAVAFPLGTHVVALEGPPPARQRLLPGYVAYYWEHTDETRRIAVRFLLGPAPLAPLDIQLVKP